MQCNKDMKEKDRTVIDDKKNSFEISLNIY